VDGLQELIRGKISAVSAYTSCDCLVALRGVRVHPQYSYFISMVHPSDCTIHRDETLEWMINYVMDIRN
jgi:hypothetical protein